MRRINIKSKTKIVELNHFLFYHCHCFNFDNLSKKIWELNVGKSLEDNGIRFSIQSKARVGNQLVL